MWVGVRGVEGREWVAVVGGLLTVICVGSGWHVVSLHPPKPPASTPQNHLPLPLPLSFPSPPLAPSLSLPLSPHSPFQPECWRCSALVHVIDVCALSNHVIR